MNRVYGLWTPFLWVIFAAILASLFFYAYNRYFDHDEFEHIHTAWKIMQGREIYVDFFQHHHPFLSYMITPVLGVYGSSVESIMVSRYMMLVLTAGILAVTYLLSLLLFKSREMGVLSLILTSTTASFYMKTIEIRPDVPQTLAGLLSIYFLFKYYDSKGLWSLIASSVMLAVSFLFLQKSIVLIAVIGALLLYDSYKRHIGPLRMLLYGAVFILCLLPYFLYLVLSGSLGEYFMMNWVLNHHMPQVFGKYYFALETVSQNIITCVLFAIGVVSLIRSRSRPRFTVMSLSLIALTFVLFKNIWHQYLMLPAPLVGIIAAYSLCTVFPSRLYRMIVILGVLYVPMSQIHNQGFFDMDGTTQKKQFAVIEYVLSITDEGDKVYDGNILFNVFRDDIDYFWYCVDEPYCLDTYRELTGYEYDIYYLIYTQKPKVIYSFDIPSMQDVRISNFYSRSLKYPDLYIRNDE